MAILFVQYLAICNNNNLPKQQIFGHSKFKSLPNIKYTFKILPKNLKMLPKWQNFAKSDNTGLKFHIITMINSLLST